MLAKGPGGLCSDKKGKGKNRFTILGGSVGGLGYTGGGKWCHAMRGGRARDPGSGFLGWHSNSHSVGHMW